MIDQVLSTREALEELKSQSYQIVISDMGRTEDGGGKPDAGILLLERMKEEDISTPVLFYSSEGAVKRYGQRAIAAGALAITSSPLDIFQFIQHIPIPLHKPA